MLKDLPASILDSHIAVLGKTGVGKSAGIRASIIEPLLDAGQRVCCIDPTDAQWGIRLTPAGKPSHYDVIVFGGNHGDRPLNAYDGEAIGEAIGTSSSSVIISTKKMRPGERTLFFTAFAEALLRTNVGRLHLIIDEAHLFAPQSGGMGLGREATSMLHATNDLVSLGRGAGLCIVLATQRPAKIHKDSVSQCETLIAMRMSHPLDQVAIEDWIGLRRIKRMKTLPQDYLAKGEKIMGGVQFLGDRNAYVWAPDPKINVFDQIAFPTYKTFDSGERNKAGASVRLAPIDMTALEGKLKQVAERAEADDPNRLRAKIAALEARIERQAQEPTPPPDDVGHQLAIDVAEASGRNRGRSEALKDAREKLSGILSQASAAAAAIEDAVAKAAGVQQATAAAMESLAAEECVLPTRTYAPPKPTVIKNRPFGASMGDHPFPNVSEASPTRMSPSVRKILDAIHAAYPVALSFPAAAARASISKRSSQYRSYERDVRASPEVIEQNGRFRSAPGFQNTVTRRPDEQPVTVWSNRLPPSYGAMLRVIAQSNGSIAKEDVARLAGVSPTSSGLTAGLKELLDLDLVVKADSGRYALSEHLR
jgi:hypothetical protein